VSVFTQGSQRDKPSLNSVFVKNNSKPNKILQKRPVLVKLDSKGRISIPNFLRKNFNLKKGDCVELVFDLEKDFLVLKFPEDDRYDR